MIAKTLALLIMVLKVKYRGKACCIIITATQPILSLNPFTAVAAIWQFEVITHAAMFLTLADKYF